MEDYAEQLKERRFNHTVDYYLAHGKLQAGMYEDCTTIQKLFLQTIKRALKRSAFPDEE